MCANYSTSSLATLEVGKLRPLLASGIDVHVDTTEEVLTTGRRRRRHHSVFFKAEAVGACQQPGVSIASVALARGLNANLLRRWVLDAERGNAPIAIRSPSSTMPQSAEGFVPVSLSSSPPESVIQIELHSGAKRVSLQWPASQACECALLLPALMK